MKNIAYIVFWGVLIFLIMTVFYPQFVSSASRALMPNEGGTGIATTTTGNIGNCLKVSSASPFLYELGSCGSGGGGDSVWSRTLGGLLYTPTTTDSVAIGGTSTSSAPWWFSPVSLIQYIGGKLGIGSSTPAFPLSVTGDSYLGGNVYVEGLGSITSTTSNSIVIFTSGQSNFAAASTGLVWTPASNLRVWDNTQDGSDVGTAWYHPEENEDATLPTLFANEVAKNNPTKQVYLINVSRGGTYIAAWIAPGGSEDLHTAVRSNVAAALAQIPGKAKIDIFAWWQGENDATLGTTRYGFYLNDLTTVIHDFYEESWWATSTPELYLGLGSNFKTPYPSTNKAVDAVRDQTQQFVAKDSNNRKWVETTGLDFNSDGVHLSGNGRMSGALRMYNALKGGFQQNSAGVMSALLIGKATTSNALKNTFTFKVDGGMPVLLATTTTTQIPTSLESFDNWLYVGQPSTTADGLKIYDTRLPHELELVGSYNPPGDVVAQALSSQYAYLLAKNGTNMTLDIVDVSIKTAPVSVSTLPLTSTGAATVFTAILKGKYLYVTINQTLSIIDVTNPRAPFVSGSVSTAGISQQMVIQGKYAYVSKNGELAVIDISAPTAPYLVIDYAPWISTSFTNKPKQMVVKGKYLYSLANVSADGFQIFDISDPLSISLVSSSTIFVRGNAINVIGDFAYIQNGSVVSSGVEVWDVSDVTAPERVAYGANEAYNSSFFAVIGNNIYMAGGTYPLLESWRMKGADVHNLSAGSVRAEKLSILEDSHFAQSLSIGGGLSVGVSGIYSLGGISAYVASSTSANPIAGLFMGGSVSVGSTTPSALLSLHANSGDTRTNLFSIGSSTASATTTLFSVSNTGSTTAANGFNITNGCYAVNGTCLTSGGGSLSGGIANALTYWINGTTVGATSSPTVGSLFATGTVRISNTTGSQILLDDTDASANQKTWVVESNGGDFEVSSTSDAGVKSGLPVLIAQQNGEVGINNSNPTALFQISGNTYNSQGGFLFNPTVTANSALPSGSVFDINPTITYGISGSPTVYRNAPTIHTTTDISGTIFGISIIPSLSNVPNTITTVALFNAALTRAASSTGTTTNLVGYRFTEGTNSGTGVIVNQVGIRMPDLDDATNNTSILIGNDTSQAGNYGILSMVNYPSLFQASTTDTTAGPLAIGSARAALVSGNSLGNLQFWSNDTNYTAQGIPVASLGAAADGTHTGSSAPTALTFFTTPSSSLIPVERVRISNAGNLGVGTTSPFARLSVHANVGDTSTTLFAVGSSTLSATTTHFSISNTGSISASTTLASCGGIQTNAAGTMSCTSDARLKDLHGEFSRGLEAILGITPQTYSWKEGTALYDGGALYNGFVAQDVQKTLPEGVKEVDGELRIQEITIVAALVNAVKEQQKQIEKLSGGTAHIVRSVEENYQWCMLALLLLWNIYLTITRRKTL